MNIISLVIHILSLRYMSEQHIPIKKKVTFWNYNGNNKYHVKYNGWHELTQFSLALKH
jgi:hypothetical protein